jgi:hypothetical protein
VSTGSLPGKEIKNIEKKNGREVLLRDPTEREGEKKDVSPSSR